MTKIVIPKKDSNELDSVEIVITGDDEGIEMARSEIMEIVRKQISNYRGKTMVPKFLHQFIGPTISALEKDMNVKVHLPPLHGQNDQNISEEIVIVGEMDNVVSAVYKLNKIVAELVSF
jgi:DNA-binding transcriptional regulator/RsmH inhibitor MraZ